MTKEQAIKILKSDETDDSFDWSELGLKGTEDFNRAWDEAYDMAIKALEQEPCKDAVSRLTITDFADRCRECGKNTISKEKIKEALDKMERGLQSCFNTVHCKSNHDLLEGQERAFKYCIETLKEALDEHKTEQVLDYADQDTLMPAT